MGNSQWNCSQGECYTGAASRATRITCHSNYLWVKYKSSFSDNLRPWENSNVVKPPLKVPGTALQLHPWNADLLMANLKGSLKTTESTPHIYYMRNWGSRRKTVIWPWSHGESTAEKNIGVQLTLKVVLFCPKVNLDFLLPNTSVSVTTRQHGSHYFSRMAVWTYVPTSQTP